MTESIALSLDPDSPLPLYHQIVVALRYRIATGGIGRGERLPAIRVAAERWDVNYHTVRRAYGVLEEMGLVRRRRGAGTEVIESIRPSVAGEDTDLSAFVGRVVDEGRRRFGLSRRDVARLLDLEGAAGRRSSGTGAGCTVVECNAHQCADLAGQIRRRFAVDVREHLLGSGEDPPSGPLVGTFFHFSEMQDRWLDRRGEMYFPTLHPDPSLRDRLLAFPEMELGRGVPLCERDEILAEAMAHDLARIVQGVKIVPVVDRTPGEIRKTSPKGPILVAPRVWDGLPDALRGDPGVIEVRYVFRPYDLEALASALGWGATEAGRA